MLEMKGATRQDVLARRVGGGGRFSEALRSKIT
jgi:hypothetical protein